MKILISFYLFIISFNTFAIVGGEKVKKSDNIKKSTYAVVFGKQKIVCGGSFYTPRKFLTAAHCLIWIKDIKNIKVNEDRFKNAQTYKDEIKKKITKKLNQNKKNYSLKKTLGISTGISKRKFNNLKLLSTANIELAPQYWDYLISIVAENNNSSLIPKLSKKAKRKLKEYDKAIITFSQDIEKEFVPLISLDEFEYEFKDKFNINGKLFSLGYGVSKLGSKNRDAKQKGLLKKLELEIYNIDDSSISVGGILKDSGLCYSDSGGPVFFVKPNGEVLQVAVNRSIAAGGCAKINGEENSFLTLSVK